MKRFLVFACLILAFTARAENDGIFYGPVAVSDTSLSIRNNYYWSVGSEINGLGTILPARQVISTGVSQADFRLCTYEDGSPIFENGCYFINVSSRSTTMGATVYAIDINTCRMTLIGALQGIKEDGTLQGLVAPHIMYNRKDGWWYVFAHITAPHQLCYGKCRRDPRYGLNEVNFNLLDYEDIVWGDEDNFIWYDEAIGKWVLVYSRKSTWIARQVSDRIDGGYKMDRHRKDIGSLTGVNAVKIGGKLYLVAGYGHRPSEKDSLEDAYKVFDAATLEYVCDLNLDIPTGGFRGWGTVLAVPEGEGTKYQLLTFDRINPTGRSNWEYGNTYMYEAVERNSGYEYDLQRPEGPIIKADAGTLLMPQDLHFRRKFTQRLDFEQEIPLGRLDLSGNIFIEWGNPYPVNCSGEIRALHQENSISLKGRGTYSLLAGSHIPNVEYVVDLSGMAKGETRFLQFSSSDGLVRTMKFRVQGSSVHILTDPSGSGIFSEAIVIPECKGSLRIQVSDKVACFVTK